MLENTVSSTTLFLHVSSILVTFRIESVKADEPFTPSREEKVE